MGKERDGTDVAWVTCRDLPEPDVDEAVAIEGLRRAGLRVEKLAWDDPAAPHPGAASVCVLRSCWNYYEDPSAFSNWIALASNSSVLLNGPGVVNWNLHKRYLGVLERRGIPIVPTAFLERGSAHRVDELLAARGWADIVVKPSVSAGSFSTARFRPGQLAAAQAFLDLHLARRDMLVQCFVPSVETSGESCAVWIDGAFTHAVIKQPRFAEDDESVSPARPVGPEAEALGLAAIEAACDDAGLSMSALLYARIDTVEYEGRQVIGELELLEPSLFLLQSPEALERFVQAVAAQVDASRTGAGPGRN